MATQSSTPTGVHKQWEDFKVKFERKYESEEEEQRRKEIFVSNVQQIEAHNEKYKNGEVTFTEGVNQFADLTPDEFNKTFCRGVIPPEND